MQTLPRRRRTLAAVSLLVAAPLVTSCGFDVGTDQIYQPAQGVNARSQGVDVLGAVVVSGSRGSGRLVATLVSKTNSRDELTGVSGREVQVSGPAGIAVPSNSVGFANLADDQFQPIIVDDPVIDSGYYVPLRFTFARSGPVTVNVPVVDADGAYTGLAPGQSGQTTDSGTSASNDVAASGSQGAITPGGAS